MPKSTQATGNHYEQLAKRYLIKQGLRFIEANYRCKFGELDLIMQDGRRLIFCEVRYRKTSSFGNAADSIHWRKQQKLICTAACYLKHRYGDHPPASRFDALCIDKSTNPSQDHRLRWIKSAFELS